MLITDYRRSQRNDLRDLGLAPYFQDDDLDDFHSRALRAFSRYRPLLKPLTLQFTAGQEVVALPADWQDLHRPSFEQALDIVGSYTAVQMGYGLLYAAAEQGSAPTAGMEMDFAGRWLPYDPWQEELPANPTYTFLPGNPPQLVIRPAPDADASYPIFYFASYQLPSVSAPGSASDADSDLILAWACHLACDAALGDPDMVGNFKIGDRAISRDEFTRQLAAKSQRKCDEFENVMRFRPIGSMG